ncbi:ATP-dependent DNA helicase [Candidatus Gugararchaeum adminiculabundum]|nr:ATP-dependent DNA helicase [Candidatus Gugararchaeum adminiculabundum]
MPLLFRHAKQRDFQKEMISDIASALENKQNLMCHAPLGLGKTDASLSAALTFALEHNLTVFFLTPKISQHKIAVEVIDGINKKNNLKITCADVVGRRYMCGHPILQELDSDSFYPSCERKRQNETCDFFANARGYTLPQQQKADALFKKIMNKEVMFHNEVFERACEAEACPYEFSMKHASGASVIVADYFQLFRADIRKILLARSGKKLSNCIVIVDEAHNLAHRVREQMSTTINSKVIERCSRELKMLGLNAESLLFQRMERAYVHHCVENLGANKEKLVSRQEFIELFGNFMEKQSMASMLEDAGKEFIEKTNHRSGCIKFARFLASWDEESDTHIRVLRSRNFALSKNCLDARVATAPVLNQCYSSILMSGTLVPLEMHRDILGVERAILKEYKSPFPRLNRLNIITTTASTQYRKRGAEEYSKLAGVAGKVVNETPGNAAVFFPSYKVLRCVAPLIITSKQILTQNEKMTPHEMRELLHKFNSADNSVIFAVQGGSLSEGLDYANNSLKCAVIVGIALEEMSIEVQAVIDYCEKKFGKGWEYGYLFPAIIKGLQAAGRCVRSENDKGLIVFLDERFAWQNYSKCFPKDFDYIISAQPELLAKKFWQKSEAKETEKQKQAEKKSTDAE